MLNEALAANKTELSNGVDDNQEKGGDVLKVLVLLDWF